MSDLAEHYERDKLPCTTGKRRYVILVETQLSVNISKVALLLSCIYGNECTCVGLNETLRN